MSVDLLFLILLGWTRVCNPGFALSIPYTWYINKIDHWIKIALSTISLHLYDEWMCACTQQSSVKIHRLSYTHILTLFTTNDTFTYFFQNYLIFCCHSVDVHSYIVGLIDNKGAYIMHLLFFVRNPKKIFSHMSLLVFSLRFSLFLDRNQTCKASASISA